MLKRILFSLFLVASLAACQKVVLLQGLEQRDANEIMVLLNRNGIKIEKQAVEKQQEVTWTLMVNASDENQARQLLVDNNLPRHRELGLSGVCKESGLIPTPKMEKCRELLALKGEIINSLRSVPGVVAADVVLNIPDKEDFPDENNPPPRPTASVVLQVDKFVDPGFMEEAKLQRFVANAVPGMDMRDVAVVVSRVAVNAVADNQEASPPITQGGTQTDPTANPETNVVEEGDGSLVKVGGLQMDAGSVKKFKIIVSTGLLFFVVMSGALIGVLLKLAKSRKTTTALAPVGPAGPKPALTDKTNMDELVAEAGAAQKKK